MPYARRPTANARRPSLTEFTSKSSHRQPSVKQGEACYKQGAACYNLVATSQPPKQVARPLYIGDVTTLQPIIRFLVYSNNTYGHCLGLSQSPLSHPRQRYNKKCKLKQQLEEKSIFTSIVIPFFTLPRELVIFQGAL